MRKGTNIVSAYLERPTRSLYDACHVVTRDRGLAQPPCHSCQVRDLCEMGRARSLGYVILRPRAQPVASRAAARQMVPAEKRTAVAG